MKRGVLFLGAIIILTLLVWNVYLVNENKRVVKERLEMELKFNAREGDLDIARYDLLTTRDSIRILLKHMDSVPVIQRKF